MSKFLQSRFVRTGLVNPFVLNAPAAGGGAPYVPASFVFNGTDEELTRTLSTSGASTTIATISVWIKRTKTDAGFQPIIASDGGSTSASVLLNTGSGGTTRILDRAAGNWGESVAAVPATDTWEHWVFRYDSTQGTADNRILIYRNGTVQTDSNAPSQPGASESNFLFLNGNVMTFGNDVFDDFWFGGKLAFIDVLEGVSADPTAFAFDDGGTWTRMPYAGSYGTYGFSLDGTDGFNDVSGNGQNFTGVNMDGSNLDVADLPPYTS